MSAQDEELVSHQSDKYCNGHGDKSIQHNVSEPLDPYVEHNHVHGKEV